MAATKTMSVSQALVEFLGHQWTVDGDIRERTIPGMFGIFGHGNVAGIGQALKQFNVEQPDLMPYYQARNEQAMVHQSVGFARMHRRRATLASAASVGPGAANMLTGAALATTNRLPALLLPSDTFATRVADPVLQQIEQPWDIGLTVNDAFRPLSKFFDRVQRPEQLYSIALAAMRVLTDPAETGAVTIALPEDVQAERIDVPVEFLQDREWHIRRPLPERGPLARAVAAIRVAKKPFIVAGGGVLYSGAEDQLRQLVEATGIPVGTSQAGGGSLTWDHPQYLGGVGATGTLAANRIAAEADVIIGIGTRYSDFTTASRTAFQNPDAVFVNINVAPFDAFKHGSQLPLIADAREALTELAIELDGFQISPDYAARIGAENAGWDALVDTAFMGSSLDLPGQPEIIGAVQSVSAPEDIIVQAAGSLPGDLHKLWRVRDTLGYNDEYLMLNSELVTAVAEGIKLIVILIQNHGYASIGHLSETVGSERFGTWYREYDPAARNFQGEEILPVDLAMNARSYGLDVIEIAPGASAIEDLKAAVAAAKASTGSTFIHINSDPLIYAPDGDGWWDVPVPEVSTLAATQQARQDYLAQRAAQKPLLG